MVFFIADPHFGHENVLRLCNRPFETIEQMNETLIQNWNHRVTGSDNIYIIGDMFFRCEDPEAILRRLHGKKHLIVGNHDSSWMGKIRVEKYFKSVELMAITSTGTHAVTLCHYPLLSWKHARTSYMIHGHIHVNTDMDFWPLLLVRENVLNAGVDLNNFQPVTLEELIDNNRRFKTEHPAT
ncbi:MAG: fructose-bisphosphatase class III [Oscillospiraceae bacterium]|nr:fructose-bisphosphatase class III [Oscillospiraceae bacterium]